MNTRDLIDTSRTLVVCDKGPLVMDEDKPTCNKRSSRLGIPQTEQARRPSEVVQRKLRPVLDRLNIPRAGFHAFRHCHASLLIDVGANPKVAQQQMRHADARTTLEAYAHVIGDSQREAVERVGEMRRPDAEFCAQVRPN